MKKTFSPSTWAFSIIEVMVGIFIFSLWLISIYALLVSSLKVNDYNKDSIIAWNLAREQIELLRNIRDTNYKKLQVWNQVNPDIPYNPSGLFSIGWTASWSYYTIESDFSPSSLEAVRVTDISSTFLEGRQYLSDPWMLQYRICEDLTQKRYVYCPTTLTSDFRETYFYKYILLSEARNEDGSIINNSYLITSKVIWFKRWYHEFDIKTLITDWRRI